MLKRSVILAHPLPGSFNHAFAETAVGRLRGNSHMPAGAEEHRAG